MRSFYFKDRDGQTPLPEELKKGLIPSHIQNMGELDEYEEDNITEGLVWLEGQTHKDYLQYSFWLKLHEKLFSDVWKWAGKMREHELDNPYFHLPHQIWPGIKKLEDDLNFWLKEKPFSEKEIASRLHERLLTIHPFANGNGRFSRILTEYVCQQQRWATPTWGESLKDAAERRKAYIAALNHARDKKNFDLLVRFVFS